MRHARVATIALVVLALAGGTTAGCGSGSGGSVAAGTGPSATSPAGAPSPTPPAAKDTLLASVKTFDTTTYGFQIKQTGMSGQGICSS